MTIALTTSMQSILTGLQSTDRLMATTQERLSSGKKVNSALDNPSNYFSAYNHLAKADALMQKKDAINEGIQTIKQANTSIESIRDLIKSAKGVLSSARSTTDATALGDLATQYNELRTQIDQLATDAGYKGVNFLGSDSLTVNFNEDNSSTITLNGFDASSTGLGITALAAGTAIDSAGEIDAEEAKLDAALTTLTTEASKLSSNLSVLSTREQFITNTTNILKEGAAKLTNADANEESANMLALQIRQQLSMTALSLANQASQSILRLF